MITIYLEESKTELHEDDNTGERSELVMSVIKLLGLDHLFKSFELFKEHIFRLCHFEGFFLF